MEEKRLKKIMIFIGVLFIALGMRLAYIQLIGHKELSAATQAQSLISLEGSNTRGIIYDRNGAALVADEKSYIYIMKKEAYTKKAESLLKETGAERVTSDDESHYVFSSTGYDKETGEELIDKCGAYILQASSRYSDEQTAAHLIGYVNKSDASGAAGLELMFDEQLSGLNRRVYAAADVKGNIIPGRGLLITSDAKDDSYIREGIRTTIDKELQKEVEEIIEEEKNDCAVVVLDSKTGGVAAMACTPGFDPAKADRYVKGKGDELVNKATQGEYPPGSIFKMIVAAAALEQGTDEEKTYVCSGEVKLQEVTIGCDTGGDGGHGEIDFEDAFAQSCNSFFIQLAQDIGDEKIAELAYDMGLGEMVIEGFPQESKGHIMSEQERNGDGIGNFAIGQGETLVTPLQIAAMTNIIAAEGIDKGTHLLMDEEQDERRVISEWSAKKIREMMKLAAKEGTGNVLGTNGEGEPKAAVKTGTAEYGTQEGMTHGWMTGFTPIDEPEYVITVLVENGISGSKSAGPIYRQILEYLEESGSYSRPTLA